MKTSTLSRTVLIAALAFAVAPNLVRAAEAAGKVKIGYTYMNEQGSMAVNQETFNWYEGPGLSLQDWRIGFANGSVLTADLNNITLNNRNLKASFGKTGLFSFSVANSQYRRFYDFNGGNYTRRNRTSVQASVQPIRWVRLFGGYDLTQKHGQPLAVLYPPTEIVTRTTDFKHSDANVGIQVGDRFGIVRADYRHFVFDDKTSANHDRTADNFNLTAFSRIPRVDFVTLSAGYSYRQDKITNTSGTLKWNQYWFGGRATFPCDASLDYRLVYGYAQPASALAASTPETDHIIHTISAEKSWGHVGGLRVGYEYQITDDFINKTHASGLLTNGWLRPDNHWFFRANLTARKTSVDEGAVLLGNEDLTRHLLSARYSFREGSDLSLQWQGRVRKNADVNTRVEYNAISSNLNLTFKDLGQIALAYSYNVGKFYDEADTTGFEFADHMVSGTVSPRSYKNLAPDFGFTWYRSKRSLDIEKFNLNFGLTWTFLTNHHLEVRYNVFNYDDYIVQNSYYTANIVEVNLTKDLKF